MGKQRSVKSVFAEIAGWYGALAIIAAYALVSFEIISSNGILYQVLNLTGALGVIVIAIHKRVTQSIVLNVFWSLVAVIALLRIAF
jgi:hypothetical protein